MAARCMPNMKLSDALTIRTSPRYRKDKSQAPIDFDSLPAVDVDVPAIYRNKQFSNEFQLLYEGRKLHGVAGIYYLDANAQQRVRRGAGNDQPGGAAGADRARPSATSTPRHGRSSPTSTYDVHRPVQRSRSAAAIPTTSARRP